MSLRERTIVEAFEDIDQIREAIKKTLKGQLDGDLKQLREALIDLKNWFKRRDIIIPDLYGDLPGEGE